MNARVIPSGRPEPDTRVISPDSQLVTKMLAATYERAGVQRVKPIQIYCGPSSSSLLPSSKSMTEQPSAMCRVNVRVGLQ